jgi:hypothetical protein
MGFKKWGEVVSNEEFLIFITILKYIFWFNALLRVVK